MLNDGIMHVPQRPADLPDFETPPVTEVVLGMQFGRVPTFTSAHYGLFWEKIRERYPRTQEVPPLVPQFEVFGAPAPTQGEIEIGEQVYMPPRCWFISDDDTQLVQLQSDRLVHNWRSVRPDDQYPRYEPLKESFTAAAGMLNDLMKDRCGMGYVANQCEVSYINRIEAPDGSDWRGTPGKALVFWNDVAAGSAEVAFEDIRLTTREVVKAQSGAPVARLAIQLAPTTRRMDGAPILVLTLTVRGRPKAGDLAEVLAFFDMGRELIVRRFKAITTPEMHKFWRIKK